MNTGVDIEEVQRFKHLLSNKPGLLKKIFTEYEWDYASKKNSAQTLAGLWCAKESVVKAMYANGFSIMIRDVHICHKSNGVPHVQSIGGLNNFNLNSVSLSISHTSSYAVAVCIISE